MPEKTPGSENRMRELFPHLLAQLLGTIDNVFRNREYRKNVSLDVQFTVNERFTEGDLVRFCDQRLKRSGSLDNDGANWLGSSRRWPLSAIPQSD
jgi:hypothetical protein